MRGAADCAPGEGSGQRPHQPAFPAGPQVAGWLLSRRRPLHPLAGPRRRPGGSSRAGCSS